MKITDMELESLKNSQINIQKIVDKIDRFSSSKESINEGNTCNQFILPFFQAFGWMSNFTYWDTEHRIGNSNKHVDYAFSKNGYGWAYVEAKRIRYRNIDKNKNFVRQIAGYFNAAPQAHLIILTNGEEYCFYSYGDDMKISTTPFIKFNIHDLDLTGNATFLRHLFISEFSIGAWPKYAEMSRTVDDILHTLRSVEDGVSKRSLIRKIFFTIYPNLDITEAEETLDFFLTFK